MDRRLISAALGSVLLVGMAGMLIAAEDGGRGPAFIAGDRPVTEGQVREKLQSEGFANVQIVREGKYFEAIGTKQGTTSKVVVDSQTGRLRTGNEAGERSVDDDDDD